MYPLRIVGAVVVLLACLWLCASTITVIPTNHRFYTLMHDPQYRLSIAWQNVAYNQPPHTGFYLGEGMKEPPKPNIQWTEFKRR